jgi:hypothetical protein
VPNGLGRERHHRESPPERGERAGRDDDPAGQAVDRGHLLGLRLNLYIAVAGTLAGTAWFTDIYHDGIFGPQTLAATRQFQASHGLPANGQAGAGTTELLAQLAPAPRPVSVAAALLTVTLAGVIVVGTMTIRRRRERAAPAG